MRWITFYFSGTGNSWWVTREFTRIAREKGIDAEMYSIEQFTFENTDYILKLIENSDMIGFSYPIYAANMPAIMQQFICKLVVLIVDSGIILRKSVYLLTSVGYMNSYGPFAAKCLFNQIKWKIKGHAMVRIANNISEPKLKTHLLPPDKLEGRKQNALKFMEKWVTRLSQGKRWLHGVGPWLLAGILIRKFSKKRISENYAHTIVDMGKCSKCFQCIRQCPTQAIRYEGNVFKFSDNCTACMRCYNFCPTGAIGVNNLIADLSNYPRYKGPVPEFHPNQIMKK